MCGLFWLTATCLQDEDDDGDYVEEDDEDGDGEEDDEDGG